MKYLLDTNTISDIFNKASESHLPIHQHISQLDEYIFFYSQITNYEMFYGLANAKNDQKVRIKQKITKVHQLFSELLIPSSGAELFGELKAKLTGTLGINKKQATKFTADIIFLLSLQ